MLSSLSLKAVIDLYLGCTTSGLHDRVLLLFGWVGGIFSVRDSIVTENTEFKVLLDVSLAKRMVVVGCLQ